jgi:hypothetical protein
MTALADPIYLPVLSPTPMGTGLRALLEQRTPARRQWRPRLYRVPPRPLDEGLVYGPDGALSKPQASGMEIDLFV